MKKIEESFCCFCVCWIEEDWRRLKKIEGTWRGLRIWRTWRSSCQVEGTLVKFLNSTELERTKWKSPTKNSCCCCYCWCDYYFHCRNSSTAENGKDSSKNSVVHSYCDSFVDDKFHEHHWKAVSLMDALWMIHCSSAFYVKGIHDPMGIDVWCRNFDDRICTQWIAILLSDIWFDYIWRH